MKLVYPNTCKDSILLQAIYMKCCLNAEDDLELNVSLKSCDNGLANGYLPEEDRYGI